MSCCPPTCMVVGRKDQILTAFDVNFSFIWHPGHWIKTIQNEWFDKIVGDFFFNIHEMILIVTICSSRWQKLPLYVCDCVTDCGILQRTHFSSTPFQVFILEAHYQSNLFTCMAHPWIGTDPNFTLFRKLILFALQFYHNKIERHIAINFEDLKPRTRIIWSACISYSL